MCISRHTFFASEVSVQLRLNRKSENMNSDFDTSVTDTEDDSDIEELCKLAKIKYKKPVRRQKVTLQPASTAISQQSSTHAENTTRQLSIQQPENSKQIVTDDAYNSEIISIDTIKITGDFIVVEPTKQNGIVKNGQDNINLLEEPTPSSSNLKSTPKITILEDILLPSEKIFHGELQSQRKRQNKVNKNSKKWQRELNKKLREEGKSYLGYRRDRKVDQYNLNFKVLHDTLKPAKDMGPRCKSTVCNKSKLRGCHDITESERRSIFDNFWKTMSWEQRRQFVCSNVLLAPCKRKVTKNETSRKSETKSYYLLVSRNSNVTRVQVCRGMFLHTLGLSEWFLRYWLVKTKGSNGIAPKSEISLQRRTSPKKKEQSQTITAFFDKLPKLPSHYCRQTSSRLYLEPTVRNISELYEAYKKYCQEDNKGFLCRRTFDNEFLKSNLSLYVPKKDQCDFCCSYKVGNVSEIAWKEHIELKNRARAEKSADKISAIEGICHVLTQDVQAVKMAPSLQASALYFKTKLCVHNFTTYNLANHDVRCYWFDESNGGLEASVYASCIVDTILHQLLMEKKLPTILYSDGCCAQNRNSYLSNALLRVAMEQNVEITQKFLVKGHTQMECDSVHSSIESKLKGQEIYLPSQYSAITKTARVHPKPYEAIYLDYGFFTNFSQPKDQIYKSIRPGKKSGDPTVTDISVLIYKPDGTIWYKLNFDEVPKPLPHRSKALKNTINSLPKLYEGRLPIGERKWQHLQELKSVIPSDCHSFYDSLPH